MLELLHPESIKPLCNVETVKERWSKNGGQRTGERNRGPWSRQAFSIPGHDGGRTQELLERASIVVCTCSAAALASPAGPLSATFDHLVVDEAGQALLPETCVPMSLLASNGNCLLAGDPKQLGPVVMSAEAKRLGLGETLLELWAKEIQGNPGLLGERVVRLVCNYRSSAELLEVPSRLFYDSVSGKASSNRGRHVTDPDAQTLRASAPAATTRPPDASEIFDAAAFRGNNGFSVPASRREGENKGVFVFGVYGKQVAADPLVSTSYVNPIEAGQLVELLSGLLRSARAGVKARDVGVMATFRSQVIHIRKLLRLKGLGQVRVGTVDDYQGQEERVVFISTVMSKAVGPGSDAAAVAPSSFFGNPRRFNVAITRAKALLVVLGHPDVLRADKSWGELAAFCEANGTFKGAGSADGGGVLNAVDRIAEMAVLGAGQERIMHPEDLDAYWEAQELAFRVVL